MKKPPHRSNARWPRLTPFYAVGRITGTNGFTYYLSVFERASFQIQNRHGTFVQHGNSYHPVHPASELRRFAQKMRRKGGLVYVERRTGHAPLDLRRHPKLRFFLKWER